METSQKTSRTDRRMASQSLLQLKEFTDKLPTNSDAGISIKVQDTGDIINIPRKALSLLINILSKMSQGKSISVLSSDSELSTQQAADILNVSRPHIIKLLENNTIPYRKVGSHRRVLLRDLVEYEQRLRLTREEQLSHLSEQAQDLHLGYE